MAKQADEWVAAAMQDDRIVAELLTRLKLPEKAVRQAPVELRWGQRLPRSRLAATVSSRCDAVLRNKEGGVPARCSPTTPFSWSPDCADGSASGTGDGSEGNTLPGGSGRNGFRSKITAAERKSTRSQKSRRKEEMISKERKAIEERFRNRSSKRSKLDTNSQSVKNSCSIRDPLDGADCSQSNQVGASTPHQPGSSSSPTVTDGRRMNKKKSDSFETASSSGSDQQSCFLLPDLNMTPLESSSAS